MMDEKKVSGNSKNVTTSQNEIHSDLLKIVEKHKRTDFKKPRSEFTTSAFNEIEKTLLGKKIIVDAGCGVGLSSYYLALENPDQLILGIDRSLDRLERNNFFKKELPTNLLFVRGKLDEWWPLLLELHKKKELFVTANYILYPNPYPKPKSLKLRFHANPVFKSIMEFESKIILRSNFLLYLEEFKEAASVYKRKASISLLEISRPLTYFEKKYHESGHALYELMID